MTRVLVLGRNGQLARALATHDWPGGWDIDFAGREALDLNRLEDIAPFLKRRGADVVINTAAYTAVDRAESDPEAAFRLNAAAAGIVAQSCQSRGALLMHISTDYVFGGAGDGPHDEDAAIAPVNIYGQSKAEGEARVLTASPDATVARTAWLLSPGAGFVSAILSRAQRGEPLTVVDDQVGSPTLAADLAQALIGVTSDRLEGHGGGGRLHMAGPGHATWFDLASALVRVVDPDISIRPVPSTDYVLPAQRPRDSRLDVMRLQSNHGIRLRPWNDWITETALGGLNAAAKCVEIGQQSGG